MKLSEAQQEFVRMLGLLLVFAYSLGYTITLGRGRVSEAANKADGGHEKSLHLKGLAQDLNLFKDGEFLTSTEAHLPLGEFWESIGGSWGGRFTDPPDGNHYSLEWKGMK